MCTCIKINKIGKQEVGVWWVQKHFPQYGVPIWSLWPNIRFLPSIVAEKNATKNEHICSMCIKISKVGKQEVGIWWVQKRFPQYGIPIWRLWPNIRFLPSTVTGKNATKNILDGRSKCVLWFMLLDILLIHWELKTENSWWSGICELLPMHLVLKLKTKCHDVA
jgi:hypothetical protein